MANLRARVYLRVSIRPIQWLSCAAVAATRDKTKPKSKPKQGRRGPASWLSRYLEDSRRLDIAVLLTAPLFVAYEAGLLFFTRGDVRNAADVRLKEWAAAVHPHLPLVLNTLLLLGFVAAALRREKTPVVAWLTPALLLEACAYALVLGPLSMALVRLVPLATSVMGRGPVVEVLFAIGAGLYEELLFRLLVVGGLAWILGRWGGFPRWFSLGFPVFFGAVLFSLFHHVGPLGDPFEWRVVAFRALAGVLLGVLFVFRGFTVTAWTHAIYDLLLAL